MFGGVLIGCSDRPVGPSRARRTVSSYGSPDVGGGLTRVRGVPEAWAYPERMDVHGVASRAAIGAATAVLALLGLAAMHVLPAMGMALPQADAAPASAVGAPGAPVMAHTSGAPMAAAGAGAVTDAVSLPAPHPAAPHGAAMTLPDAVGATVPPAAASSHGADGVPSGGHSLVHLCFAVLVVALTLAFARWLRPRAVAFAPLVRAVAQKPLFSLDVGPPNRVALCVVRC